jgi:glucose/arabinose dehydrogenase
LKRIGIEKRLVVAALTASAFMSFGARAEAQIRARLHASGFASPVAFVQDPDNRNVQFVVEQGGRIRVVRDGVVLGADFLNLTTDVLAGGERGLLGMAFAPQVGGDRFFVNFTNRSGDTVVARFRRTPSALTADPASRFDLRWGGAGGPSSIAQPFSNHNGGHLAFGPDGYLYIGLGDGGFGNDPDHRAQNPQELLGKMLRIDVGVLDSDPSGYRIPGDNPFVAGRGPVAALPEIWSFGWRNPWRYSFDDPARGGTGALVVGDVGQSSFEEIDYEPRGRGGRNYGWRNREGAHDNITSRPPAYTPLVDPIYEYGRASGQSVTGGLVYRGQALPANYRGRYFFADFVSGRIWSIALTIDQTTGEATASQLLDHTPELGALGNISSFGVDATGEMYVVGYSQGSVFKIVGPPPAPAGLRIIR